MLQPDRDPWSHNVIERLYALTKYDDVHVDEDSRRVATSNKEWLHRIDGHASGVVWVPDKQGSFLLFDFVKYAGPSPHRRSGGRPDTPASLFTRACEAFADRPALGVPLRQEKDTVSSGRISRLLSRSTPYTSLAQAAGVHLQTYPQECGTSGADDTKYRYAWLSYGDLGRMVDTVAKGCFPRVAPGSHVGISGYNDIEFCVADFACAVAGIVSVGIHGTHSLDEAATVLRKSECVCLCYMQDLLIHSEARKEQNLWCVQEIMSLSTLPLLKFFVVMDAASSFCGTDSIRGNNAALSLQPSGSFGIG